ncbi:unnamed protein product [Staurois parvus]|uniref:Uncharacterized protein n=1 Tax=Staurois parvus TaxID=386267 RepID=A0ABN9DRE6_9NEOB|nr:unnamed protein product [Staurois parvus]
MQHCTHMNFLAYFFRQIKLYFGGIYSPLGFFFYIDENVQTFWKKKTFFLIKFCKSFFINLGQNS